MPVTSRVSSPYLHRNSSTSTLSRCGGTIPSLLSSSSMPSSSSACSRVAHMRSVSLDRSASSALASARISRHLQTSLASSTSSPPKREHLELRERLARLELASSTTLSFTLAASKASSSLRSPTGSRMAIDALYDQHSPVLTKFRRLGDSAPLTRLPPTATRRVSALIGGPLSTGIVRRRRDSECPSRLLPLSSSSFSSMSSRSSTLALEEMPRSRSRSRSSLDINRNLLQSGDDRNGGNGEDNENDNACGSRSPVSSTGSTSSRYSSSTSGYGSDTSIGSSPGTPHSTSRCFQGRYTENGGIVGLRNLGNTCFMNSVLQCLSHTRPMLEYCLKESYMVDINTTTSAMKGALIKAFAGLLQSMWQAEPDANAISPQTFKNQVQKFAPRFMGYSQQDAQEFLRYLLQGMHEDVNRVTCKPVSLGREIDDDLSDSQKAAESWRRYIRQDDSRIVDLFVGQLKSTLQCTFCGYSSVTFDPFWDLSLPIPKTSDSKVQLRQCLDLFTKEEVLDGDEKPTCSKCKTRRKCTKSFSLQKFPKILVIHLKRFSPSERYKTKLSINVDFPLYNLDLSSYATSFGKSGQNCVYNLYGVSNHSGSVYTGHYTATCKHPFTGDWHDFNDSRVSKSTSNNVASTEGYVLFYEQAVQSSRL